MIYDDQTEHTIRVEAEAASVITEKLGMTVERMPGQYRFSDFIGYSDDVVSCLIEIKSRNIKLHTYKEVILSWSKFVKAHAYVFSAGIPFIVVFCFKDCVAIYQWRGESLTGKVKLSGRTVKYRRPQDIEPCVYIPVKDMEIISMEPIPSMCKGSRVIDLFKR